MNRLATQLRWPAALLALLLAAPAARAFVDDALSFAYEAANPYAERGWIIREDAWGGDLGEGEKKAVTAQLFRGNSYMFFLATDVDGRFVIYRWRHSRYCPTTSRGEAIR